MAKYRKIDPRIWNDAKFRNLGDDGQLAFLFILTHPAMTSLGAMRATPEGLASERKWPAKRFKDAIRDAIALGMVEANEDASFVGVPNFLRYNEPEGPNSVIKAWVGALDLIPECPEKVTLMARCLNYLNSRSDGFKAKLGPILDAMRDAMRDACPIQEQEQEQEQEQDIKPPTPLKGERKEKRPSKVEELDRYPQELHEAIATWRELLKFLRTTEIQEKFPEDKRYLAQNVGTVEKTWQAWEKHLTKTVGGHPVLHADLLGAVKTWAAEKQRRALAGVSLSGPMLPSMINHADFVDALVRCVKTRVSQPKETPHAS